MENNDEFENDKKARVIHARVPEELDRELRRKASRLGMSVSNLVRNALQNAFGLVGDIVADSADIARSAREPGDAGADALAGSPPPPARPAVVLGWQTLTLNLNALCSVCNTILPKGTEAAIAVTDQGISREFRCTSCTKGVTAP